MPAPGLSSFDSGRGCSTAAEHMPCNLEVMGLNPAGCRAFFFFQSLPAFLHQWSVLNQVPQGGASLTVCCERNRKYGCLAVLPGAKQVQYAQIGQKKTN